MYLANINYLKTRIRFSKRNYTFITSHSGVVFTRCYLKFKFSQNYYNLNLDGALKIYPKLAKLMSADG